MFPKKLPTLIQPTTGQKEKSPRLIKIPKAGRTISAGMINTVNLSKKDRKKIPEYPKVPNRLTILSVDEDIISSMDYKTHHTSVLRINFAASSGSTVFTNTLVPNSIPAAIEKRGIISICQ